MGSQVGTQSCTERTLCALQLGLLAFRRPPCNCRLAFLRPQHNIDLASLQQQERGLTPAAAGTLAVRDKPCGDVA